MGTPLLQQISLMDNGILDNIDETPEMFRKLPLWTRVMGWTRWAA